ncbi:MAG: FMN-binding negative transcriptional regulator [Chloroflexota bacterium]|nr:FMN-binding negative transcriptional regulator [Chloroflexota bacterium]
MYDSERYRIDSAAVDAFVAGQRHGTLIATPPGGHPQVSLLPFVKQGDQIELHCVREDPTFAALVANPRCTFLVSDFLAFSPHDWVEPDDGGRATLHFRAVQFECEARTSTDPDDVAAALARLLAEYEPHGEYPPLRNDAFYGPRLGRLAVASLTVVRAQAKFKVGPAGPVEVKRRVVEHLRERGEPNDARAAAVIESYFPETAAP